MATTINGGAGNDVVNVSSDAPANAGDLDGIAGPLTFNGQADNDTLNLSDAGGATANNNVIVTATEVQNLAGPADNVTVTYGTLEALDLTGNANAEVFNVRSSSAATTISQKVARRID